MANRKIEAHHRQSQALQLRLQGLEYAEIAERLGYADKASAYVAIRDLIARHSYEGVDEMRTVEGMKLNKLEAKLWDLVDAGDLAAIDRLIKVMQRRANLYGLDLAGRVDIVAGGEVDLDGAVARLIAVARGQQPSLEGDDGGV